MLNRAKYYVGKVPYWVHAILFFMWILYSLFSGLQQSKEAALAAYPFKEGDIVRAILDGERGVVTSVRCTATLGNRCYMTVYGGGKEYWHASRHVWRHAQ